MTKLFSGLVAFLFCINSYGAECTIPVKYIEEGIATLCSGYLFSPRKEFEVRIKMKKYDNLKQQVDNELDINRVLSERLQNAQKFNTFLNDRLQQENRSNFWQKTMYFTLGAILTGAIASNVR